MCRLTAGVVWSIAAEHDNANPADATRRRSLRGAPAA
jgi:hypothetical protein